MTTKTLPFTVEYMEFYHQVMDALSQEDAEELKILRRRDARWFDDIIEEVEEEMHCTFNRRLWEDWT